MRIYRFFINTDSNWYWFSKQFLHFQPHIFCWDEFKIRWIPLRLRLTEVPFGWWHLIFVSKSRICQLLIIVLYAQETRQKSYGPILNLPILTDTDSNRFLRILTLPIPIPILIHKYHTDTDTDFLKNTDIPIPIPIIPIIGPSLFYH